MGSVEERSPGAIEYLGHQHRVAPPLDAPFGLERAHLDVYPINVLLYRAVVKAINQHVGNQGLMAGPDCPEVFFLTGRYNPTGVIFDFLNGPAKNTADAWHGRDVVVINHRPAFSPPLDAPLTEELRSLYRGSVDYGPFEIRWRQ